MATDPCSPGEKHLSVENRMVQITLPRSKVPDSVWVDSQGFPLQETALSIGAWQCRLEKKRTWWESMGLEDAPFSEKEGSFAFQPGFPSAAPALRVFRSSFEHDRLGALHLIRFEVLADPDVFPAAEAMAMIGAGSWRFDLESGRFEADSGAGALLGFDSLSAESFCKEDQRFFHEAWRALCSQGRQLDLCVRLRRRKEVMVCMRAVRIGSWIHGTILDISRWTMMDDENAAFFSLTRDYFAIAGFDGYFKRLSPSWETLTGFTRRELMAEPFLNFVHPLDRDRTHAESSAIEDETHYSVNFINRYRCKDGRYIWLDWSSASNAEQRLFYCVARDVTRDIENRNALEAAMGRLERADQAKAEFLNTIGHEIRTPMNALIGMTGLLMETKLSREQDEYVQTIRTAGANLLALINDLLDFGKFEKGGLQLERDVVVPHRLMDEIVELATPDLAGKSLELSYQLGENLPVGFFADHSRLRQVLLNLVKNAIKFTKSGHVSVRLDLCGEELWFAVEDSGIGIAAKHVSDIFEPFQQIDGGHNRRFEGAGLGLAICRALVWAMNGKIWVESVPNEGSTFFFHIPLERASEDTSRFPVAEFVGSSIALIAPSAWTKAWFSWVCRYTGIVLRVYGREGAPLPKGDQLDCRSVIFDGSDLELQEAASLLQKLKGSGLPTQTSSILLVPHHFTASTKTRTTFDAGLEKPLRVGSLLHILKDLWTSRREKSKAEAKPLLQKGFSKEHPLRLLIAEDNAVNQKMMIRLLEKLGYNPDVAANGREVLTNMAAKHYDLIFMDVQMPEMDGLEATRRIVEDYEGERPVIVALTANTLPQDREKCFEAGMDDFIGKPVNLKHILKTLTYWSENKKTS